jgi:hypothetical protein
MPQVMLIKLIYHVILLLNAFPSQSGISDLLLPWELVLWHCLNFKRHCKAPFSTYCKAHDDSTPTNNMVTQATPAIVLEPTGNLKGTYKFFSLKTGKKIKRHRFTPYPMPDLVIRKVEHVGRKGGPASAFDFADRSGIIFEWNGNVDKSLEDLVKDDLVPYLEVAAKIPGVILNQHQPIPMVEDKVLL